MSRPDRLRVVTTTVAATFCATLVDEWVRAGVGLACVSPGSRSTPLALALAAEQRLAVAVFVDERSAAFAALGHGLATGRPAVALCTSGTAATHFHAAMVEADLSSVPLIACTADRPPELWDIGAPQTIDQTRLYGTSVRYFAQPGVPDEAMASSWRPLASRLAAEALGWSGRPGPVQLNLSFRDPLVGQPAPLPPGRDGEAPWHQVVPARSASGVTADEMTTLIELLVSGDQARSGVIIAGRGRTPASAVLRLARSLGWPVLADHRSGCRSGPEAIASFDALLRSDSFARMVEPEVVLRFGEALSSKVLGQWLARSEAHVVAVIDDSRWVDPEQRAATVVAAPGAAQALLESLPPHLRPAASADLWRQADTVATAAIEATLAATATATGTDDETETECTSTVNEVAIAREVVANLPANGALVVSSSMPIRDVEWFGPNRADVDVYANRGANGIDGVVSTAVGVALSGRPTTVLVGDVAFLHDSSALIGLRYRPIDLHIVVIDNNGGGIFSFLPQASALDASRFELLFGTPHGTDLAALARAHGLDVHPWSTPMATPQSRPGLRVTVAHTDRAANVALHARLNASVVKAIES